MAKALQKLSPYWFELPTDEDEQKTRWYIKPLDGEELTDIMMNVSYAGFDKKGKPMIQTNARSVALSLRYGVIGWENFRDEEGNEVEFSELNKKYIHWADRIALSKEVIGNATMNDALKKKS